MFYYDILKDIIYENIYPFIWLYKKLTNLLLP